VNVKNALTVTAAILGCAATGMTEPPASPVFTKDVFPILQHSCQSCHRPGQIGPFSMLTYQDTRPWAKAIKQQVVQRNMPPWYIDKTVGVHKFKNDISLSDADIDTIAKWVDAGAPLGNLSDMLPARQFDDSDRWHISKPDIVVHLNKDVTVKARQPDQWIDVYTQDLGLTADRYVQAVEIKPISGARVVHHANSEVINPEAEMGTTPFASYSIGKYGDSFPDGSGLLLRKGSKMVVTLHLHAVGVDTPVDLGLALKLLPEGTVPKHVLEMKQLASTHDLDIPPNVKNVRVDGYTILPKPAVIISFQPHMHNRGQAQCLELIMPRPGSGGGSRPVQEMVSCVDRFKFDWHVTYEYDDDVAPIVPAGTIVHQITLHDNTAANPSNPDPSNWVGWGERTADEMSLSRVNYYFISEEEYKDRLAARAAAKKKVQIFQQTTSNAQPLAVTSEIVK
jgi:hypothetical protein